MPSYTPTKPKVYFHLLQDGFSFSNRTLLKVFIESLFRKEKKRLEQINYIFCSDNYLLKINKQYLNHDFFTDIITFDLSVKSQALNAEVYISVDRVRDNARDFSASFKTELHRVIFHGALHLCGYSDKKPLDRQEMRKMEDKYLGLYFKR
jgi:probable rRNA maturation factor